MVDIEGYLFPDCVWEQTPSGKWASRPADKEDEKRRKDVVATLRSVKREDESGKLFG